MPDGVYVTGQDGAPMFVRAPQLTDDDVQKIVETTAKRVVRLLQRRGVLEQGNVDPLWEQEPLLATITAASEVSVLLARCSRWFLSAKRCASSRNTCNRRRLAEVLGRSHPRAICLHDRTHRTGFIYRQRENRRLSQGEDAYFQMDNSPTI
jgi:hypothetical protein